jgi:hypothetical protein
VRDPGAATAEQFASEAQGFFPQLEVARSRDGATEDVYQLVYGREDGADVFGQFAGSFVQPALSERRSSRLPQTADAHVRFARFQFTSRVARISETISGVKIPMLPRIISFES